LFRIPGIVMIILFRVTSKFQLPRNALSQARGLLRVIFLPKYSSFIQTGHVEIFWGTYIEHIDNL